MQQDVYFGDCRPGMQETEKSLSELGIVQK